MVPEYVVRIDISMYLTEKQIEFAGGDEAPRAIRRQDRIKSQSSTWTQQDILSVIPQL